MSFTLSESPLGPQAASQPDSVGALVEFEGRVRSTNQGKRVVRLEYTAYPELAVREGERIIAEARARFEIVDVAIVHRVGILEIGDVAVRVAVSSAHRGPAFEACRWVMDELKARVPIWKREQYEGSSEWL